MASAAPPHAEDIALAGYANPGTIPRGDRHSVWICLLRAKALDPNFGRRQGDHFLRRARRRRPLQAIGGCFGGVVSIRPAESAWRASNRQPNYQKYNQNPSDTVIPPLLGHDPVVEAGSAPSRRPSSRGTALADNPDPLGTPRSSFHLETRRDVAVTAAWLSLSFTPGHQIRFDQPIAAQRSISSSGPSVFGQSVTFTAR